MTTEQVAIVLANLLMLLAAVAAPAVGIVALADPTLAQSMVALAIMGASSPATGALLPTTAQAIAAALMLKQPNVTGYLSGVGCPGLLAG